MASVCSSKDCRGVEDANRASSCHRQMLSSVEAVCVDSLDRLAEASMASHSTLSLTCGSSASVDTSVPISDPNPHAAATADFSDPNPHGANPDLVTEVVNSNAGDLEKPPPPPLPVKISPVEYRQYRDERDLPLIMKIIDEELSEPYSIFTYRYFINQWPQLCYMAFSGGQCIGTVVCKLDQHREMYRGYIAMLVVIKPFRGRGIASELVKRSIETMRLQGSDEVALEAEVTNKAALALYENLGFIKAKRLHRYYLNGVDAFRLKLLFPYSGAQQQQQQAAIQYGGEDGGGQSACA
ncbi:hypothetical protein CBR_g48357 [Chara braunii]|uniref:N-acetyltransferase domain-containing protein n=1 Tax=Chara braunii TaxID=69332 RepID=A0A388K4B8_CHABU|nr:hypothetical protein CBR_g48357 [Chara braunii]|eukprot:GBG64891.1 hypothetical protein CBR_g48357 [Chara braunii]